MMYLIEILIVMTICNILPQMYCAPFVFDDDDDEDASDPDLRKKHKNKKKPCTRNDEARFFFPINFSYSNVNYNYNCGEDNPQQAYGQAGDYLIGSINNKPGHHRPFGHKPHHHGGNKPSKPGATNKPGDVEHDPIDDYALNQPQKPTVRPFHAFVQNHSQGMGILHTIVNGIFGSTAQTPPSPTIPVHEIQEDTNLPKWRPGKLTLAYNPINGQHAQDSSQMNSKELYRRIDRFLRPILDFF